jgi:hypothetical protein
MADLLSMPRERGEIMASDPWAPASLSPQHAAALAYAAANIAVFPIVPGGKRPATEHGFKDRTTDLERIKAWWSANPAHNVAIVPEDAGWCVIDIDPKSGGNETWARLTAENPTPATRTVLTPSGGRHLYFLGSAPPS